MLNQLMSNTTNTKNKKTNKKASTEHAKSAYVTQNKQTKKTKTKEPRQNMLSQLMSRRCERRQPSFFYDKYIIRNCNFE